MARACTRCQVYYPYGDVCPQCGQQLIDYEIPQQYPQPQYAMNGPQPQPPHQPQPPSAVSNNQQKPKKQQTWLVILLSALVAVLAIAVIFLGLRSSGIIFNADGEGFEGPSASEKAVVQQAWDYYSGFVTVVDKIQASSEQRQQLQSGGGTIDLSTPEGLQQWEESMSSLGGAMQNIFTALVEISVYGNQNYVNAINNGIASLSDEYPQIVSAWQELRNDKTLSQVASTAGAYSNASNIDWTSVKSSLETYGANFKNACTEAGFDTSSWMITASD